MAALLSLCRLRRIDHHCYTSCPFVGRCRIFSHSNRLDTLVIKFEMLCQMLADNHGPSLGQDQIFF